MKPLRYDLAMRMGDPVDRPTVMCRLSHCGRFWIHDVAHIRANMIVFEMVIRPGVRKGTPAPSTKA